MASVWFACCAREDYPQMLKEVQARDARAQLLRFGAMGEVARFAEGFPDGAAGAVLFSRGAEADELERAVGDLARSGRVPRCLVFVDELGPARIARLFHAGATEVIAADGVAVSPSPPAEDMSVRAEGASPTQAGGAADDCDEVLEVPIEIEERYAARMAWPEEAGERAEVDVADAMGAADATGAEAGDVSVGRDVEHGSGTHRAPVVTVMSGRGGVGKTTLVAAMACCAARQGLRTAVLDLDLMFGDLCGTFGIDEPRDLAMIARSGAEGLADADIEASAMRVGPGLTLWGPVAEPERAELLGAPCERLMAALRGLADVIFADTSVFWGDAVAAAIAGCDRCLVVGAPGASACSSAARAMSLAARLGVPRTKMTSVVNRFGAGDCGEEFALRFEMATSLRSKARIAEGGAEVAGMLSFGRVDELASGRGAFAESVRRFTMELLRELGCPVASLEEEVRQAETRPRIRLPWKRRAGERP